MAGAKLFLFAGAGILLVTLWLVGSFSRPSPPPTAIEPTLGSSATGVGSTPRWARLPAGTFQMGCTPGDRECDADESPRHSVTLSRAFDMTTTEVTVAMVKAGFAVPEQPPWTRDDHPVVNITWGDAAEVCTALGGRLPTEAEWEYAARGGANDGWYPWGNDRSSATASVSNGARFSSGSTVAVATYAPNSYGLYDMAGNVWEWVADRYGPYGSGAQIELRGAASGSSRVVRGGSWFDFEGFLRVSNRRFSSEPWSRDSYVGVRCARDVSP